ncbi:MAG TPA: acyl-CoA dehydrogenase family protein [Acidimicrobiales bacterium]|nr:acyl-CoA dehydrogenase family protein [Acidimicrobiales bacterium]
MTGGSVLDARVETALGARGQRSDADVVSAVRHLQRSGALHLPLPGGGRTQERWSALAALGRHDLCVARLAEGHVDALAILHEADRSARAGALYGVWASRSGGRSVQARRRKSGWVLDGRMPFCSGAGLIDRALVAAFPPGTDGPDPGEQLLFDVDLAAAAVRPEPGTWPALGMDATASLEVTITSLPLDDDALVGGPGFYTGRPGFHLGGAGVAAVWLGGAAAAVDAALAGEPHGPHRLALVGGLHTQLSAADALVARAARCVDARPGGDHVTASLQCRAAAEAVARRAVEAVPMVVGPARLSQDRRLAQHLADLQLYIGQYHVGADLARLAERLLIRPEARW